MKRQLFYMFLLIFCLLFWGIVIKFAFAKEKFVHNDLEYELRDERESKNKVRKKYYKKVGDGYSTKKQKLKDDLKGWEEVDA